ncbi:hypothetical protein [Pseudoalteromonas luteoviolacea]|uniref:hypothetical protein n=3 Tax=Pseudoalteromonas luteoviolacea TaxID=43657 RepID=UPI00085952D8|nr:hypothetical protein [Pseudoalteromonas luteoviolacea]AOT10949.1 hypothetical protein S4054249_24225 [Pseudoalteromonas luteoviolacea]AOT15887.1 hypothetical protein S40542_24285 [Pseudoalteromonas luteoviolacea]AOT20770.1 hypothetical protein S4054_24145 [Pseudoalteromonas luteoviolacea]
MDGHLWRELEVTEHEEEDISYFKDVNLAYQKGPQAWRIDEHGQVGERVATGEQLKQVLVPNKLYGQPCRVEIAFSETQWCWRQIEAFGGMSENDPRLNYGPSVKPGTNDDAASERRSQRMQVLDKLGNYAQGYSNDEAPQHIPLPRMPKNGLHRPVLKDPIGVARYLAAEIVSERKNIQQLSMESIKGAPLTPDDFEDFAPEQKNISKHVLATTIQSQFFAFPNTTQQKVDLGMSVSEHEQDMAQNYKSWVRAGFSKYEFRRYLKTEQALTSARAINVQKSFGFDHITREDEPMSFYQAVKDYGYYEDVRRNFMYELISDVTAPYTDLTKTLIESFLVHDSDFRAAKQIDEEDMGQELMLKVLGTHPLDTENAANSLKLTALMYPKKTGTALSDYECARRESSDPFDTVFSVELQQQIQQDIDEGLMSGEQREFWRRASQMIWGVLAISFSVPTSYYAMGGAGADIKASAKNRNELEQQLKDQTQELEREINSLEQNIASKNKQISEQERVRAQVYAEMKKIAGADPKAVESQNEFLKQQIQARIEELEAHKRNHARAKSQLIKSRQGLKNLEAHFEYFTTMQFHTIEKPMSLYDRFQHLASVLTGDLLEEVDIDVNDYYNGKLPDGKLPLNFQDKAKRAQVQLEKLARATEEFDDEYHKSNQSVAEADLVIDDQHTVKSRLDHIITLDGSLDEVLRLIDKNQVEARVGIKRLQKTMLMIDESAISDLYRERKADREALSETLKDKLEADWHLEGLDHENEALNNMASKRISPEVFNRALNGTLAFVSIFEVINAFKVLTDKNASGLSKTSAVLDLFDIGINVGLNIVERRAGLPSPKQCYALLRNKPVPPSALSKRFWWMSQMKAKAVFVLAGNVFTFLAGAVSTYVSFYEMSKAMRRGDNAQFIGHGLMMLGFAGMTTSAALGVGVLTIKALQTAAIAACISGLAIFGLVLLLIGAGVVWAFAEKPIEGWLEACHWGNGRTRFKDDESNDSTARASQWKDKPELALLDLYSALYGPKLEIANDPRMQYVRYKFYAPMVHPINGARVKLMWRRTTGPDKEFKILTYHQLSKLMSKITLFPARKGWHFDVSYYRIRQVLGLPYNSSIELKGEYKVYPQGEGAKLVEGTETEFMLPSYVKRQAESFWKSFFGEGEYEQTQGGLYLQEVFLRPPGRY